MVICIYLAIILLVATKLLDVLSTLHRIKDANSETNPIARKVMARIGTRKAIWITFLIAICVIGIAGVAAINSSIAGQILFLIAGILISCIQAAVAHANWHGVDNAISKLVRKAHLKLCRMVSRKY